ncbi:hypothetical protein, variant 1 [Aphanomyces astaci]|uniref:Uncharacterized protein n=1 Tax=Aphanomyces astaci TaxID=112090 RepID=W4GMB3_APHAT|nr:hypothetical protein, variant 1 [Aphanomyces astaci]ETV80845.1 hypothetical protein, variant 1 [Aphanomyces astaci]|eukprot:XP_009829792.1 hypothetical protein, variant 1 [Aphanomyces astaci]
MDQFVAAVFADRDVVSYIGHSTALEWMVWFRPSASLDSMHLSVYVRRKVDQVDYQALELTVTLDTLQAHMNDLGVTSDLSSFALPFKTAALSSARNLDVDIDDNGTVLVEITYVFGHSLTRKGVFSMPPSTPSATVPSHVVDLLRSLRSILVETTEEQTSRRARRSTLLLSTAAMPIQLATTSSPPPTVVKRKPALPLGARRKVARGAKFADDDE